MEKVIFHRFDSRAILPTKSTTDSAAYDLYAIINPPVNASMGPIYTRYNGSLDSPLNAIYDPSDGTLNILSQKHIFINTGLNVCIPDGYMLEIRPRSGLSNKNLIIIPNSPGTIDSDYCGVGSNFELKVGFFNLNTKNVPIKHGDRIAQILLRKLDEYEFVESNYEDFYKMVLDKSSNRTGGFGSTGS